MKSVLGWICDPYLHVFLIGLFLARLAMQPNPEPRVVPVSQCTYCDRCRDYHESWFEGCRIAGVVASLIGSR